MKGEFVNGSDNNIESMPIEQRPAALASLRQKLRNL